MNLYVKDLVQFVLLKSNQNFRVQSQAAFSAIGMRVGKTRRLLCQALLLSLQFIEFTPFRTLGTQECPRTRSLTKS